MTIVNLKANIDPSYYRLLYGQDRGTLAETFEARRPSVAERLAAGKALREKVPRTSPCDLRKVAQTGPIPSTSSSSRPSTASRS